MQQITQISNKNEKEKHIKSMSYDPCKIILSKNRNNNHRKYSLSNNNK
jgi:hypothetical protein